MRMNLVDDEATLLIAGRFTFDDHAEFRDAIRSVLGKAKTLNLDLSDVTYLDSAALGMMLIAKDQIPKVQIAGARGQVLTALNIANFGKLFTYV